MGEYEEALDRTIWFHNHALEHDIGMYGVRLSFALADWVRFGEEYPPALTSLKQIRDAKTKQIISGDGTFNLFMDVYSINSALSEDRETIELFKTVESDQPQTAESYWPVVKKVAFQLKEYSLLNKYIKDVLSEYNIIEHRLQGTLIRHDYSDDDNDEQLKSIFEKSFIDDVLMLIDLSLANGDKESAYKIKSKALNVVIDPRLENVIVK